MIGLREDQQVGAQLAARIVIFLNSATFQSGSGLARESGGSQTDALNDTPQSRASPNASQLNADPLWERRFDDSTCSRKRWVNQHQCLLGRLREQARSHI